MLKISTEYYSYHHWPYPVERSLGLLDVSEFLDDLPEQLHAVLYNLSRYQ